jgi:hypothetical protein
MSILDRIKAALNNRIAFSLGSRAAIFPPLPEGMTPWYPVNSANPDNLDYPDIVEHPFVTPVSDCPPEWLCSECGHPRASLMHNDPLPPPWSRMPFRDGDIISEW